jgi:hypothetical protein
MIPHLVHSTRGPNVGTAELLPSLEPNRAGSTMPSCPARWGISQPSCSHAPPQSKSRAGSIEALDFFSHRIGVLAAESLHHDLAQPVGAGTQGDNPGSPPAHQQRPGRTLAGGGGAGQHPVEIAAVGFRVAQSLENVGLRGNSRPRSAPTSAARLMRSEVGLPPPPGDRGFSLLFISANAPSPFDTIYLK